MMFISMFVEFDDELKFKLGTRANIHKELVVWIIENTAFSFKLFLKFCKQEEKKETICASRSGWGSKPGSSIVTKSVLTTIPCHSTSTC